MDDKRVLTEILRYQNGQFRHLTDIVTKEKPLTLIVNDIKLSTIACLDEKLTELGVGFLFSEGLLADLRDIEEIALCNTRTRLSVKTKLSVSEIKNYIKEVELTTGCGGGISSRQNLSEALHFSAPLFNPSVIPDLMQRFQNMSSLFKETGGVHSAALVKSEQIDFFAEDIGRHNAVDKVIGEALLAEKQVSNYYLLISGRISSEIVSKAVRTKIPSIISQAAPTSRAISLAWRHKIYLIGFARGKKYNIYTGFDGISKK